MRIQSPIIKPAVLDLAINWRMNLRACLVDIDLDGSFASTYIYFMVSYSHLEALHASMEYHCIRSYRTNKRGDRISKSAISP